MFYLFDSIVLRRQDMPTLYRPTFCSNDKKKTHFLSQKSQVKTHYSRTNSLWILVVPKNHSRPHRTATPPPPATIVAILIGSKVKCSANKKRNERQNEGEQTRWPTTTE